MSHLRSSTELLGELIAFPTVSADSNLALIDHLANRLEHAGARVRVLGDDSGGKANLFATLGPEGDGGLMLSGHTDVVPVVEQPWDSDPFEMVEKEGALFGRGTCDMKGFIACAMVMAEEYARRPLTRPVHFAFTYDEEVGCLGGQALVTSLREMEIRPDMAIVGEPTSMRIIEGHKGCCEYTARFRGLEGHGSAPDRGVNAAEYAARYAMRLLELREELKARTPALSRFDPPWSTINIGGIHGGHAHNVIAALAEVEWDMRPVHWGDADFVKAEMTRYVDAVLKPAMQAVDPEADITVETIGEIPGLEPMELNAARDLVARLTGANGTDLVAFGTEAGLFQSLGADVIVCGPGSIEQAHMANEYITVAQMQACLDMLDRLV
ncbi:acetylornithine deacetylase [Marinovum algicola]|uniref:acetylornithine deacetylase n=1 Tax=Marinovum algicola TaxID=42444 RepID=UPI0024BBA8EC|nr:acetylornithine deacetylase [Marinovum algicola]